MVWSLCDCWASMTSHLRLWITLRHLNTSKLQKAKAEKILQPEAGRFTLIRIGLNLLVVTWRSGEVTRKYVLLVISWHVHSFQNDLITFVETLLELQGTFRCEFTLELMKQHPHRAAPGFAWSNGFGKGLTRKFRFQLWEESNRDRILARASQIKILGFGLGYVPWRFDVLQWNCAEFMSYSQDSYRGSTFQANIKVGMHFLKTCWSYFLHSTSVWLTGTPYRGTWKDASTIDHRYIHTGIIQRVCITCFFRCIDLFVAQRCSSPFPAIIQVSMSFAGSKIYIYEKVRWWSRSMSKILEEVKHLWFTLRQEKRAYTDWKGWSFLQWNQTAGFYA